MVTFNMENPLPNSRIASTYTARVFKFSVCKLPNCCFSADSKPHCAVEEKPEGVQLRWGDDEIPQSSSEAVAISYTWGRYGLNFEALETKSPQRSTDVNNGNDAEVGDNDYNRLEHPLQDPPKLFEACTIGHWTRHPTQKIELQLGREWQTIGDSMPSFVDALQRICLASNYCWIDQLSLPQGGDDAAWKQRQEGIKNIPKVFRAFEVITVLPGAMCECVNNPANHWSACPHVEKEEAARMAKESLNNGSWQFQFCYNILGAASYFQRIWPRQEMFYARRIRLEWASSEILKCNSIGKSHFTGSWWPMMIGPFIKSLFGAIKGGYQTGNRQGAVDGFLNGLFPDPKEFVNQSNVCVAEYWKEQIKTKQIDDHFGFHFNVDLAMPLLSAFNDAHASMCAWSIRRNGLLAEQDPCKVMLLAHFLSGKPLVREKPRDDIIEHDPSEVQDASKRRPNRRRLYEFLVLLATLSSTYRECTWPGDLINAVWVDCPGFNWQKITGQGSEVVTALDHAVVHALEEAWLISPITTLPSGLFDKTSPSDGTTTRNPLVWRPSLCRDLERAYTTTMIYAGLGSEGNASWVLTVKDRPVFSIPSTASALCSRRFFDLHNHTDMSPDVLHYIIEACQLWPSLYLSKIWISQHENTGVSTADTVVAWMRDVAETFETKSILDLLDGRFEVKYERKIFRYFLLMALGSLTGNTLTKMANHSLKLPQVFAGNESAFNEIFEMVCLVMGLEVKVAKRNSPDHHGPFHLVLDPGVNHLHLHPANADYHKSVIPPRIGLSRINYDLEDRPTTYTVCLTPPGGFDSWPGVMLEVELLDSEGNSRTIPSGERERISDFEITGVWVMPSDYGEEDVFQEITGQLVEGKLDIRNDDSFREYLKTWQE